MISVHTVEVVEAIKCDGSVNACRLYITTLQF